MIEFVETSTKYGKIKGFKEGKALRFFGVPYACPPVGELRFSPPKPISPWDGVYDATYHRTMPVQFKTPRGSGSITPMGYKNPGESEDCLYMTISTPSLEAKLPVLFHIHGGANMGGSCSTPFYDGKRLAERGDVVVINADFRVGMFGFLYHPKINTEPLNTLDLMMALRWVRENIGNFGGDSENITVLGHSSGGSDIAELLIDDRADGLFESAVIMSPSLGRANFSSEYMTGMTEKVIEFLGLNINDPNIKAKLSEVPASDIVKACYRHAAECLPKEEWGLLYRPVRDDLTESDPATTAEGKAAGKKGVRILAGVAANEHLIHFPDDPKTAAYETELLFTHPTYNLAKYAAKTGCDVWCYNFEWHPEDSRYKACHCICQPFTFGTFEAWKGNGIIDGADEQQLESLHKYFSNSIVEFVKGNSPGWPKFEESEWLIKYIDGKENPTKKYEG